MIVSYIIGLGGFVVACVFFVLAGNWVERHGGVHRWQIWLMTVGATTIMGAAVGLAVLPFNLSFPINLYIIGGGVLVGIVVGAIRGLFTKIPTSAQAPRRKSRADRSTHQNRVRLRK